MYSQNMLIQSMKSFSYTRGELGGSGTVLDSRLKGYEFDPVSWWLDERDSVLVNPSRTIWSSIVT